MARRKRIIPRQPVEPTRHPDRKPIQEEGTEERSTEDLEAEAAAIIEARETAARRKAAQAVIEEEKARRWALERRMNGKSQPVPSNWADALGNLESRQLREVAEAIGIDLPGRPSGKRILDLILIEVLDHGTLARLAEMAAAREERIKAKHPSLQGELAQVPISYIAIDVANPDNVFDPEGIIPEDEDRKFKLTGSPSQMMQQQQILSLALELLCN
jgi:hypothetical protein